MVIGCSHDLCSDCLVTQLTGCQTEGNTPDCLFCCMEFTQLVVHKESLLKKLNKMSYRQDTRFCIAFAESYGYDEPKNIMLKTSLFNCAWFQP